MPIIHRLATEEDLATWPALLIGFGPRPVPEEADEQDDGADGAEEDGVETRR